MQFRRNRRTGSESAEPRENRRPCTAELVQGFDDSIRSHLEDGSVTIDTAVKGGAIEPPVPAQRQTSGGHYAPSVGSNW